MENNSFLTQEEVNEIGFASCGTNVYISRYARFYSPENIRIGSNVRIDDFCLLSGKIELKNNIHISAYSALYGGSQGIYMEDYSGVSGRCIVYAASDDFNGGCIASVMAPPEMRNVIEEKVDIGKYAQIGAGSIVLPGSSIEEGACTGSMTLVNKNLSAWKIYVGIPCRYLKERKCIK